MDIRALTRTSRRQKSAYVVDDPLLNAREAAAERGQALSTFLRDVAAGRVSPYYRVSPRCRRWRRSELRADLEACRERPNGQVEKEMAPQRTHAGPDWEPAVRSIETADHVKTRSRRGHF
jgi:hypothetical protein